MFDFKTDVEHKRQSVNKALVELLKTYADSHSRLAKAMTYCLMAGGKRLRPILCLHGAEIIEGALEPVLPIACAIEMIHTYSLIHDDLPAMDDDRVRRGKPTCHIEFDEATAILAGDALLTLAFEILSQVGPKTDDRWFHRRIAVIRTLSAASGCRGMIEGQMRDIQAEGSSIKVEALADLQKLKTGKLISASLVSGALMAGGDTDQIQLLETYGEKIGLAFQVTDDLLNVEGDPSVMGKSIGTDQDRQKATYPSLLGMDKSRKLAESLVTDAISAISPFGERSAPLEGIALYILERKR